MIGAEAQRQAVVATESPEQKLRTAETNVGGPPRGSFSEAGEGRDGLSSTTLAYLYTLPAFLIMAGVILYPFLYNVVVSFSNMNLLHFRDWSVVGFRQYGEVFSSAEFYRFFGKTILWTVLNVAAHVSIGVFLAMLLNKNLRGKAIIRTLLILPWAVPQVISALTWRGMFTAEYGAVNLVLDKFGILGPAWLSTEWGAFFAAVITNIWLGFPFMMVIALGGLQSIPDALYEAADIDGATWWDQFRNITMPLLKPVMVPAITLGTIWTFNNFNVIYLVTNGGEPSDKNHIIASWMYKAAFSYYRFGYAAAFSMVVFVLLLVFGWSFIQKTKATQSVY